MTSLNRIMDQLEHHQMSAATTLGLVPSESVFSAVSKVPFLLDCYHRYFFNSQLSDSHWHFRGAQDLASIEVDVAIPLLAELCGAKHVNLRPLSGLHAMLIAISGLTQPGDRIFCLDPAIGGHYATVDNARRLGLNVGLIRGKDPLTVDLERLADDCRREKPALVYIDQSHGLFPFDVASIAATVKGAAPGCLIHVDASHWLGLIFGGVTPNPLAAGADSFGGSTHKTFPGPHKGIFATNRDDLAARVAAAQFPMVSNHNFSGVVALAMCLLEFREHGGVEYVRQVVRNSRSIAQHLSSLGLAVTGAERNFTHSHQVWLDVEGRDAQQVSSDLAQAGLRTNVIDDLPGFARAGLRLGTAEATYRGFREPEMRELAEIIAGVIHAGNGADWRERTTQLIASARQNMRQPDPCLIEQANRICGLALG